MIRKIFLLSLLVYSCNLISMAKRLAFLEKKQLTIVNNSDKAIQLQTRTMQHPIVIRKGQTTDIAHPGTSTMHLKALGEPHHNVIPQEIKDDTQSITICDEEFDPCLICCLCCCCNDFREIQVTAQ